MSALDTQVGGSHYKDCAIQPIQYIEANNLKFLEACVVKRCTRHDKPTGKGRQDIEKAIHELQLLLDMRYPVEVKAEPLTAEELDFDEERIDRIAASHGDGEHYESDEYLFLPRKDGERWDRQFFLRALRLGNSIFLPDTGDKEWMVLKESGRVFVLKEMKRLGNA